MTLIGSTGCASLSTGLRYRLGPTNHPQAQKYQGKECEIIAVRQINNREPMISVRFLDGAQIRGLFFCELEDVNGRQLSWSNFKRHKNKILSFLTPSPLPSQTSY